MSDEHNISANRLRQLIEETDLNSRRMPPHDIFPGWWLEVHLALTELQTCRAALSAMRKHAALLEQELSAAVDREELDK